MTRIRQPRTKNDSVPYREEVQIGSLSSATQMLYKTIYFDTSFYVHLQRAALTFARVTIDHLQKMRVRRVESVELFFELDVSPNTEGKRLLVDRLARWSIPRSRPHRPSRSSL